MTSAPLMSTLPILLETQQEVDDKNQQCPVFLSSNEQRSIAAMDDTLDILLLDQAFLRVPLECANTAIRSGYKSLELDMLRLTSYIERHLSPDTKQVAHPLLHGDSIEILKTDESRTTQLEAHCNISIPITNSKKEHDFIENLKLLIFKITTMQHALSRILEFVKKIEKKILLYQSDIEKYILRSCTRLSLTQDQYSWPSTKTISQLALCGVNPSLSNIVTDVSLEQKESNIFARVTRRLDTLIYDYLMRSGLISTAGQLKKDQNLQEIIDEEIFDSAQIILQSLKKKVLAPALAWATLHKTKLKKLKSPLESQLRLQDIVCCIGKGHTEIALQLLRKHFKPEDIKEIEELKCILGVIAFLNTKENKNFNVSNIYLPVQYENLFNDSRWELLATSFQTSLYQIYGLPKQSLLELLINCGVAALKSKSCQNSLSPSCPTCDPFWKSWMDNILTAHHVLSFVVCPVKGHVMDDSDPPIVSPDGLVFSTSAVTELKNNSADGKIECPCTGNRYSFDRFHRLYISTDTKALGLIVSMSSLAAARADNFYYPPDYGPKHGSLNKFRGSHPLGDRAKKLHEGILVIRFEMPYKVFCTQCHEVIAKGVRFNAEKKCVGNYFTTKILEFSMKCCFCPNIFRIQTDPKECEYKIISGLHKKIESFSFEDSQTIEFRSEDERAMLEKDAMLKLETTTNDLNKANHAISQLEELIDFQESRMGTDNQYKNNSELRKRFRTQKVIDLAEEEVKKRPVNFSIPLIEANEEDSQEAKSIVYITRPSRVKRRLQEASIEASRMFNKSKVYERLKRTAEKRKDPMETTAVQEHGLVREDTLIPCKAHPALTLVVKPKIKCLPSKLLKQETPDARKIRLRVELERLKLTQHYSMKASV